IANYVIARGDLEVPEEEENVFGVLATAGAFSSELERHLRALVGFRNILVHDYLAVDSRIVHRNLREGLRDFRDFARAIVEFLTRSSRQ
ncbi:MAG: type VII toxin-antitoxin system HepT family RNase toxin, partial [Candidatus Binatia bacterium]